MALDIQEMFSELDQFSVCSLYALGKSGTVGSDCTSASAGSGNAAPHRALGTRF